MLCSPSPPNDTQSYELRRDLMHLAPGGPRAARPGHQLAGNLRGLHTPGIPNCIQNSSVNQQVTRKAYLLYTPQKYKTLKVNKLTFKLNRMNAVNPVPACLLRSQSPPPEK